MCFKTKITIEENSNTKKKKKPKNVFYVILVFNVYN